MIIKIWSSKVKLLVHVHVKIQLEKKRPKKNKIPDNCSTIYRTWHIVLQHYIYRTQHIVHDGNIIIVNGNKELGHEKRLTSIWYTCTPIVI